MRDCPNCHELCWERCWDDAYQCQACGLVVGRDSKPLGEQSIREIKAGFAPLRRQDLDDLKQRVKDIQLGVGLLPLGSVTPEMVDTVRACNHKLVELLALPKAVKVTTCIKPRGYQPPRPLGSAPEGVHPTFNRSWPGRAS